MQSYLKDLAKVLGLGIAVASAPLLVSLSELEPPWPVGIGKASSAFVVLASLIAWQLVKDARLRARKRWLLISTSITILSFSTYLILASMFIETAGDGAMRAVRGYQCTSEAIEVYGSKCPALNREALDGVEWDETKLWTRESISVIRLSLALSWLVFIASLIVAVGSLVAGRDQAPEPLDSA